jgi:hypothetical protein
MDDQTNDFSEWDNEVAKRIACAVTSYQAGVTYEELWQQFAGQGEQMGTFWLSVAKHIRENLPQKPK